VANSYVATPGQVQRMALEHWLGRGPCHYSAEETSDDVSGAWLCRFTSPQQHVFILLGAPYKRKKFKGYFKPSRPKNKCILELLCYGVYRAATSGAHILFFFVMCFVMAPGFLVWAFLLLPSQTWSIR
jgi:hypothetical protein